MSCIILHISVLIKKIGQVTNNKTVTNLEITMYQNLL
ncbi:hypothetical protein ZONE111904_16935 [Zobellia nedashkovskayae]